MRTSPFVLSLLVHSILIGAAIVVPTLALHALPELPGRTTFVMVTPETPAIPPATPRRRTPTPGIDRNAAPVVEPPDITPEPLEILNDVPVGVVDDVIVGFGDVAGTIAAPPPVAPQPSAIPPEPVRVGGDVRPPRKIYDVAPEYPAIARAAGVSGVVILEALIGEDGTVRDVRVLRSQPLLDEAALGAVRQWRFTPTLLNGQAVPVFMTVTVAFTLR